MDQAKANEIVQSLTVADIENAYSGKPGCACGCNGKYYCTVASKDEVTASHGYAYDDDQVNDKQVLRILRQVQAAAATDPFEPDIDRVDRATVCWNVADDLQYVTATVRPTRVYTVYLRKQARTSRGIEKGWDL
jgi:hypothetical protein